LSSDSFVYLGAKIQKKKIFEVYKDIQKSISPIFEFKGFTSTYTNKNNALMFAIGGLNQDDVSILYEIYNLTEVEVFKASLIKYGWIYTFLARIGDELVSLASESAEKYMINLLRNTMDTTMMDVVNEESNLSSIRKKLKILEENNSNIDTRILEKEFKSHRERILRPIIIENLRN
jgi:hypothetical protein